ncbi:MAG: DUF1501 domain-containing protein [Myxococcota bacterium]
MLQRRSILLGGVAATLAAAGGRLIPSSHASRIRPGVSGGQPAKKLVIVMAQGGWDVTFCMDPKLGAPQIEGPEVDYPDDEGLATYGGITIASNPVVRPSVDAFFERWHDRLAIINGIRVDAIAHGVARARMLSGSRVNARPDVGAITGSVLGSQLPLGYVDAGGSGIFGPLAASSGRIGYQSQLRMLVDRTRAYPAPDDAGFTYPQYLLSDHDIDANEEYLAARGAALRNARGGTTEHDVAMMDDWDEARDRASRLIEFSPQFQQSLRLGQHPDAADLALLTAELLAADACQSVLLSGGETFDTHQDNIEQHAAFEGLFDTLGHLAEQLDAAGLWEQTVLMVTSDFTRTPKRNELAGKSHWPINSAIVMGAGVKTGGGTYGGTTDDTFDARPVDFATGKVDDHGDVLSFEHLGAGILQLVGVDSEDWMPGIVPFDAYHA